MSVFWNPVYNANIGLSGTCAIRPYCHAPSPNLPPVQGISTVVVEGVVVQEANTAHLGDGAAFLLDMAADFRHMLLQRLDTGFQSQ